VIIVVAGPTGVGKSELAVRIAESARGEIVNFDSVQIYRGFDIGSAKPGAEVRRRVPHHLFDVVDADQEFNAAEYARLAEPVIDDIGARGKLVILVGGTYFYLRALLAGLPEMPGRSEKVRRRLRDIRPERLHRWLAKVDPQSARVIAPADRHRVERALEVWIMSGQPISKWERPTVETPSLKVALTLERKQLAKALDARVGDMYEHGLVEETRALLKRYPPSARPFSAIGYREAVAVVEEKMEIDAAIEETRRRTRAYAKRQVTWLRAERNVHWLDAADRDAALAAVLRLIEGES
jgi:tRNA dimethylallyltransferase